MTFRVGMKVVSIKRGAWRRSEGGTVDGPAPQFGCVYTIRGFDISSGRGLLLEEIVGVHHYANGAERGWDASRFRPAVEPKQEVSFTTGAPIDSERWDGRRVVEPMPVDGWGVSVKT